VTYRQSITEILSDGDSTTPDIAAELGISIHLANSCLQDMHENGLVSHTGRLAPKMDQTRGPRAKFWTLTEPAMIEAYQPQFIEQCCIIAPTGEPIPGATGDSRSHAIESLFPDPSIWPFALMNGYRLKWFQVEKDEG
jgi:hypothetical protein